VLLFLSWARLAYLFFNNNKKSYIFGKCKDPFTLISLRLMEMHIHSCTLEGAAQTNLSAAVILDYRTIGSSTLIFLDLI